MPYTRGMAATRNPPSPRRRLSVEARREELLRLGMELFSSRAYDSIQVEEIAQRAGISRGLLYHYFPTKRDFYVAVQRSAAVDIAALTAPDSGLNPQDQVRAGVGAFVEYAEAHPHGFLTAYRGSLAGDPEVRATIEQGRQRQLERILAVLAPGRAPSPLLTLALRGWIAFAQEVIAHWLEERPASRAQISELLVRALDTMRALAEATTDR